MAERNSAGGIDPDSFIFRSAMAQTRGHAPNGDAEFFVPFVLPRIQKARYAAHKNCLPIVVIARNRFPNRRKLKSRVDWRPFPSRPQRRRDAFGTALQSAKQSLLGLIAQVGYGEILKDPLPCS